MKTQPSNQQLAVRESPKALAIMAARLQVDPDKLLDTLKATVFKGANNEELLALCVVANEFGLNPLTRQIYAFKGKEGGGIVPIVSVDGWLRIINEHSQLDGLEFEETSDEAGKPYATACTIWRKDRTRPIRITEYYAECYRNTPPWNQCPRRMLRHKALIQCGRVALALAGIYDPDEGRDIIRNVEGRVVEDEPKRPLFIDRGSGVTGSTADKGGSSADRAPASDGEGSSPSSPTLTLEGQTEDELAATQEEEDALWKGADQNGHNAG